MISGFVAEASGLLHGRSHPGAHLCPWEQAPYEQQVPTLSGTCFWTAAYFTFRTREAADRFFFEDEQLQHRRLNNA